MDGVRLLVFKQLESERGFARMARFGGYASGAKLKEALLNKNGEIQNFGAFVKIVHYMFPEEKFELMIEFSKTLNSNNQTARYMLEYLSVHKLDKAKKELLERMTDTKDNHEWAFVYGMDDKLASNQISKYDAITELSKKNYVSYEMEILAEIVKFYAYYDLRNIQLMISIYDDIKEKLGLISNSFIKHNFAARTLLLETSVKLHCDIKADLREKLFIIEDALDPIKSLAYLQIGNSYIFENYEKAKSAYVKGIHCATGNSLKQLKKSMNFLSIYWNNFDWYTEDEDDISNQLYYYAKIGCKEKAITIIEKIDFNKLNNHEKAFNYYYQAIVFKDKSLLYKSVEYFNKCNEKFYKKLPIIELKKQGEHDYIINALIA